MKEDKKDVGFQDDAILYLEHGICAEEHAIQSYVSTKDKEWLELAITIRRNRSKKMYEMLPETVDERYCFSKHILGMAMTLKEMGNRYLESEEPELAKECFDEARTYESIFKILCEKNEKKI